MRQLGPIALLNTIIANPIECWTEDHFQEPIVVGGFPFARVAVLSDPTAVRKVLVETPNAYRKGVLERRILSARLRNGLAAVDGEQLGEPATHAGAVIRRRRSMRNSPP